MNIKTLSLPMLVCLLILSACAPAASAEPALPTAVSAATEKPNAPVPSAAPAEVPTATSEPKNPEYYPLSTRTGIADVDEVIAAVESGDVQSLRGLIRLTEIGCTTADGMGGPPKCAAGEAEGTLVHVLPLLGPEGSFMREAELSNFLPIEMTGIFAVYSVSASAYSEQAYPAGEYAAMFTTIEDQIFVVFHIRQGIVRMDTVFSPTSRDMVMERDSSELILAPK